MRYAFERIPYSRHIELSSFFTKTGLKIIIWIGLIISSYSSIELAFLEIQKVAVKRQIG